jgi:hypothetical protein
MAWPAHPRGHSYGADSIERKLAQLIHARGSACKKRAGASKLPRRHRAAAREGRALAPYQRLSQASISPSNP